MCTSITYIRHRRQKRIVLNSKKEDKYVNKKKWAKYIYICMCVFFVHVYKLYTRTRIERDQKFENFSKRVISLNFARI